MSIACPHTHSWLNKTFRVWIDPSCRSVSTISAIKRGLRATKAADKTDDERGVDRGKGASDAAFGSRKAATRTIRRSDGSQQFKMKKFTSDGERPVKFEFREPRTREPPDDVAPDQAIGGANPRVKDAFAERTKGGRDRSIKASANRVSPACGRMATSGALTRDQPGQHPPEQSARQDDPDRSTGKRNQATSNATDQDNKLRKGSIAILLGKLVPRVQARTLSEAQKADMIRRVRKVVEAWNEKARRKPKALQRTLRRNLPQDAWTLDEPDGTKTILWFHRDDGTLEFMQKGVARSELAKAEKSVARQAERSREKEVEEQEIRRMESNQQKKAKKTSQGQEAEQVEAPVSIPYTTAASVFLYGSNTVIAALKAKRRKLYQLHLQSRPPIGAPQIEELRRLAKEANIPIQQNASPKLLSKISEDRPHNGVVLEASSLPAPPVLSMNKPDEVKRSIALTLDRQSPEDIVVNGAPTAIPALMGTWRHPLVVMLDGITDPGNVGSILRTCHFYGVEAVAVATNTCANLNSATLAKASSGACESLQIFALPKPSDFIFNSMKTGWRVFAAVTPNEPVEGAVSGSARSNQKHLTTSTLAASSTLAKHSCILILGAEGEGLRDNLKKRADFFISIEGGTRSPAMPEVGVDSLNVSAATSVLLESFLRKPVGARSTEKERELGF